MLCRQCTRTMHSDLLGVKAIRTPCEVSVDPLLGSPEGTDDSAINAKAVGDNAEEPEGVFVGAVVLQMHNIILTL